MTRQLRLVFGIALLLSACGTGVDLPFVDSGVEEDAPSDGDDGGAQVVGDDAPTGPSLSVTIQDVANANLSADIGSLVKFLKAADDEICIEVNAFVAATGDPLNSEPGCRDIATGKATLVMDQCGSLLADDIILLKATLASGSELISFDEASVATVIANCSEDSTQEIESENPINMTTTLATQLMMESAGGDCLNYFDLSRLPTECINFKSTLNTTQNILQDTTTTAGAALQTIQTFMMGCALQGTAGGCTRLVEFGHEVVAVGDETSKTKALQAASLAGTQMTADDLTSRTAMVQNVQRFMGPLLFGDADLKQKMRDDTAYVQHVGATVKQWTSADDANKSVAAGADNIRTLYKQETILQMPPAGMVAFMGNQYDNNFTLFSDTTRLAATVQIGGQAVSGVMTTEDMRTRLQYTTTLVNQMSTETIGQTGYMTQTAQFIAGAEVATLDYTKIDTVYTDALQQSLQSGTLMEQQTGSFVGGTELKVVDGSFSPIANEENVALTKVISILFSNDVDSTTLTNIRLMDGITPVSVTRSLQTDNRTVRLTPTSSLQQDKTYTLDVGTGLKSQYGQNATAKTWNFYSLLSTFRVLSVSPACDSTNNPINSPITVNFSHPLTSASATASNFAVSGCDSGGTLGSPVLSGDSKSVTRTPASPYLDRSATCTLTISGTIQDDVRGAHRTKGSDTTCTIGLGRDVDVNAPTGFTGASSASTGSDTVIYVYFSMVSLGSPSVVDDVTTPNNLVYKAFCSTSWDTATFDFSNDGVCGTAGPNTTCVAGHPMYPWCFPGSMTISSRSPSTYYYVIVRAYDEAGNFDTNTNKVSAATRAPTPTNVTATAGNASVNVCWDGVNGASYYYVNRSGYGDYYVADTADANQCYTASSLSNGSTYYFTVAAYGNGAASNSSDQVSATPVAPPVTGLTATAASATQINLSWTAYPSTYNYFIERKVEGGSYSTLSTYPTGTTHSDTGLTASTAYTYRIRACTSGYNYCAYGTSYSSYNTYSSYSSEVSATTPAPSGVLDTTYGTSGVLTAAGSLLNSGNMPSFVYSGGNLFTATNSSSGVSNMGIAKVLSTGSLDATFGSSGTMTYDAAGSGNYDSSASIMVDSTGKIYVGGTYSSSTSASWTRPFLCRFTSVGAIDTSFQTNGCKKDFSSSSAYFDSIYALAQHPSNSNVYAVGPTYPTSSSVSVMKLWAFDSSGTYLGNYASWTSNAGNTLNNASPGGIIFDTGGNLLITGSVYSTSLSRSVGAVFRYNSSGTLDATFGTSGIATVTSASYITQAQVDQNGNIVVAGNAPTNGGDALLARLTSSGALDTTFATSGVWTYNIAGTNGDSARALVVDNTNSVIYVAGNTYRWGLSMGGYTYYTGTDLLLAKFNFNGALVTTFGTLGTGIVVYNSGTRTSSAEDFGARITLDGTGKLIIIGENNSAVALFRYYP